ncbi:hypothetical protein [Clostridium sp.]|uniref:hypothetical protein n=1 Tax=Clostridium sp. TaxID=1506 RepID=UPI00399489A5
MLKISSIKDDNILKKNIEKNLTSLYKNIIYDHIHYGFYDLSKNNVSHINFNKNLYDNSSAIFPYTLGFKLFNNLNFKEIVYELIAYIKNNLSSNYILYFDKESCSSQIGENYHTFSYTELYNMLEDDFPFFSAYYDITKEGNYKGKNILNLIDKDLELDEFFKTKNQIIKQKLVKYSNQKTKPSISKTINAGNNALFSASLSYAGNKFKDIELIKLSQNIIDFLLSHFKYNKNELILFKDSNLQNYNLDDYTLLIFALIEFMSNSKNLLYLNEAKLLIDYVIKNYYCSEHKAFIDKTITCNLNNINLYDLNKPNSNSLMILNLIKFNKLASHNIYLNTIEDSFNSIYKDLYNNPNSYIIMLFNLIYYTKNQ